MNIPAQAKWYVCCVCAGPSFFVHATPYQGAAPAADQGEAYITVRRHSAACDVTQTAQTMSCRCTGIMPAMDDDYVSTVSTGPVRPGSR